MISNAFIFAADTTTQLTTNIFVYILTFSIYIFYTYKSCLISSILYRSQ